MGSWLVGAGETRPATFSTNASCSGPLAMRDAPTHSTIEALRGMVDTDAVTAAWDAGLPEKRRVQVIEKEPLDEFTPAAHSDFLEDAAEMVLNGVLRDKEYLRDTCRG
jgi:hypothetical protein